MRTGTLVAAVVAVCVAQMALAIPAVLNGLFRPRPAGLRAVPGPGDSLTDAVRVLRKRYLAGRQGAAPIITGPAA